MSQMSQSQPDAVSKDKTLTKTSKYPYSKSFYRRNLPSPPSISFSSNEGRKLFKESMSFGFMEIYYILAEQFRTQDEPAFCGLSTLTMVLNALNVDPKRVWKGPWRWYNEEMLDCCKDLESIKIDGITFDEFSCLSRCNGLYVKMKRPNKWKLYNIKNKLQPPIIKDQIDNNDNNNESKESKIDNTMDGQCNNMVNNIENNNDCNDNINDTNTNCNKLQKAEETAKKVISRKYYTLDEFRNDVKLSCVSTDGPVIVVSYSRQELKQTGDGHFSPIAGYHPTNDMVCNLSDLNDFCLCLI